MPANDIDEEEYYKNYYSATETESRDHHQQHDNGNDEDDEFTKYLNYYSATEDAAPVGQVRFQEHVEEHYVEPVVEPPYVYQQPIEVEKEEVETFDHEAEYYRQYYGMTDLEEPKSYATDHAIVEVQQEKTVTDFAGKCLAPWCNYRAHTQQKHGYCCNHCRRGIKGLHGPLCERILWSHDVQMDDFVDPDAPVELPLGLCHDLTIYSDSGVVLTGVEVGQSQYANINGDFNPKTTAANAEIKRFSVGRAGTSGEAHTAKGKYVTRITGRSWEHSNVIDDVVFQLVDARTGEVSQWICANKASTKFAERMKLSKSNRYFQIVAPKGQCFASIFVGTLEDSYHITSISAGGLMPLPEDFIESPKHVFERAAAKKASMARQHARRQQRFTEEEDAAWVLFQVALKENNTDLHDFNEADSIERQQIMDLFGLSEMEQRYVARRLQFELEALNSPHRSVGRFSYLEGSNSPQERSSLSPQRPSLTRSSMERHNSTNTGVNLMASFSNTMQDSPYDRMRETFPARS